MFKLKQSDTFTWPCTAKAPNDGKYEKVKFEATFNILSQKEINDLMGDAGDEAGGSARVLDSALVSFSGIDVEDDDGNAVTDDDERKDIIFKYPFFVKALSDGFAAGISGYRAKN